MNSSIAGDDPVEVVIWDVWARIDGEFSRICAVLEPQVQEIERTFRCKRFGTSLIVY